MSPEQENVQTMGIFDAADKPFRVFIKKKKSFPAFPFLWMRVKCQKSHFYVDPLHLNRPLVINGFVILASGSAFASYLSHDTEHVYA